MQISCRLKKPYALVLSTIFLISTFSVNSEVADADILLNPPKIVTGIATTTPTETVTGILANIDVVKPNLLPIIVGGTGQLSLLAPAFTISSPSEIASVGTAIKGYTITSTGGAIASYSISPAASNGLTFDTTSGLLSGTPVTHEILVTYTITAHNATRTDASKTFAVTVSACLVVTNTSGGGKDCSSKEDSTNKYEGSSSGVLGSAPAPLLSIQFTHLIQDSATVGVPFSDYLAAITLSNRLPDLHVVTFSLASGSQALPLGLTLNGVTGFLTGTIHTSVLPQTLKLLFTATSPGYSSITTPSLSYLIINAADVVLPEEEEIPEVPFKETVATLTEDERASNTSATKKPSPPANKLMMTALFANNSSKLSMAQKAAIKTMSKAMLRMKIKTITIMGFTNVAMGVDNKKLATARAKTLANYLKLNNVKQSVVIKSLVASKTKANQTASALVAMRKAEIWVVFKT